MLHERQNNGKNTYNVYHRDVCVQILTVNRPPHGRPVTRVWHKHVLETNSCGFTRLGIPAMTINLVHNTDKPQYRTVVTSHEPRGVSYHQLLDCLFLVIKRKHQNAALLAFCEGNLRRPVESPHKWPVMREVLPLSWRNHMFGDIVPYQLIPRLICTNWDISQH